MPEQTETTVPLVSLPEAGGDEVGVLGGRTRILVRPDQVGDRTLTVGPGANLVAPRDIPHTFRNAGAAPGKLVLTIIPGRFGNYFIEVDAVADPDRETVRRLAAKYDVELLDQARRDAAASPAAEVADPRKLPT